ncbi:MAG: hypothetical protein V4539_17165 [Bacteroidota bacterium]
MRLFIIGFMTIGIIFLISCNHHPKNQELLLNPLQGYDSMPFGMVQPLLAANTPGEKLLRIDSLAQTEGDVVIYYVTDKGTRFFKRDKPFPMLVVKGYKADGGHSCVGSESNVQRCYDSACTIVVDTFQVHRTKRPYSVLHPELDNVCVPCPPVTNH